MTDPIIRFDNVTYSYPGTEEPALRDIDLSIMPGEYVAILGLNGAGKTTLGLCVNGVVPTMLGGTLEGTVTVNGLDVEEYPVREMAKLVGMVFDNPEFIKAYPMKDVMLEELKNAVPRPVSPVYQNISTIVSTTLSPPGEINPQQSADKLRSSIQDAIEGKGILP